jgi:hypothetical protein
LSQLNAQQHLARAKDYADRGDSFYEKAADEILAAKEADPTLGNGEIGERLGRSGSWVSDLVRWRTNGDPDVRPFAGSREARLRSETRKLLRDEPRQAAALVAEAPPKTRRAIARELARAVERDETEARERRTREHGTEWHDYTSEALRLLSEARRLIKDAHAAVMSASRTDQLTDERRQLITASAAITSTSADYVKEAAESGHDMDAALAELLEQEA